jgi:hypothetical protein
MINQLASDRIIEITNNFNGDALSLGYFSIFKGVWNESFSIPSISNPSERAQFAVSQSVPIFLQNFPLDDASRLFMQSVAGGLDIENWNNDVAITSLSLEIFGSQIPDSIISTLGLSSKDLLTAVYNLSPTPNREDLSNLTIDLFSKSLVNQNASFPGLNSSSNFDISVSDFISVAYNLGNSPEDTMIWALTSQIIASTTVQSLSNSPLFIINESSLYNVLLDLRSAEDINSLINEIIKSQNFDNYPIVPRASISRGFVGPNNDTMIALMGFDSLLNSTSISRIKDNIETSSLYQDSTLYITGNSVFAEDMAEIFSNVESLTIMAGILVSLIIAAVLFRSPIAAIFPLLIAGVAILISYPAIYLGVVVIGQGTISFMTPILTVLLMLGLGVDYSVILLRRTREERIEGKSNEDSVRISTRWAGQAVITAGVAANVQ